MANDWDRFERLPVDPKDRRLYAAHRLIGWIASNHAMVEQQVAYFSWQLQALELRERNKYKEISDNNFQKAIVSKREEIINNLGTSIKTHIQNIDAYLILSKIINLLNNTPNKNACLAEWQALKNETIELSDKRNTVVHSGLAVNLDDGSVMREIGKFFGKEVAVNPLQEIELVGKLGKLSTKLGVFITNFGHSLSFKDNNTITTFPPAIINF